MQQLLKLPVGRLKKKNLIVFDNTHDQEGVCDARHDFPYVKLHSMFPLLRANRF